MTLKLFLGGSFGEPFETIIKFFQKSLTHEIRTFIVAGGWSFGFCFLRNDFILESKGKNDDKNKRLGDGDSGGRALCRAGKQGGGPIRRGPFGGQYLGCGGRWIAVLEQETLDKVPIKPPATVTNKGCSWFGEKAPTGKCGIEAGETKVVEWSLSGDLDLKLCQTTGIAVGANYGKTITHSYKGTSEMTINDFCQMCTAAIYAQYTKREYSVRCSCGSNVEKRGFVTRFDGDVPEIRMDLAPNCNPNCPPGG